MKKMLVLFSLIGLIACVPARIPSVVVPVTVQPRFSLEAYRDSLAVIPFGNLDDKNAVVIASEIEATLSQIQVRNAPYFTLINRSKISDVLKELRLTQSGLLDDQTASQIGRLVGAKILLVGDYTIGEFQDRNTTEERTDYDTDKRICKKYDAKGQCIQWEWRKYNVSCTSRFGSFTIRPKAVNVERGTVLYSTALRQSSTDKLCEDEKNEVLATRTEMIEFMLQRTVTAMSRDIAPYVVNEPLPFIEKTTGMNEADAKTYNEALIFILASPPRVDRACAIWKGMYPRVTTFTILHALGVCAEVDGDLTLALEFYTKADAATSTPVSEISGALQRIKRKISAPAN